MPTELLIAIVTSSVAAINSIVCTLIAHASGVKQDKANKDARDYRTQREKLDKAKTKVLLSTMEGVTVLLYQAKGEKLNGNVEAALCDIRESKDALTDVRSDIAAQL